MEKDVKKKNKEEPAKESIQKPGKIKKVKKIKKI